MKPSHNSEPLPFGQLHAIRTRTQWYWLNSYNKALHIARWPLIGWVLVALALIPTSVDAMAASATSAKPVTSERKPMDEVFVLGSRRRAPSALESPVPIVTLDGSELHSSTYSDLSDIIRDAEPSFNVNLQPISDGGTISRPANMRGLAPDHTLVLLNGKRRHRSSIISWVANGVADGAQGPDISAIPAIALKRAEVLRDGASAQYGSDAIAGVLNFVLKDASEGAMLDAKYGQYQDGHENLWHIAGNIGLPLTAKGFANLSIEYGEQSPTDRSVTRNDVAALIDAGNFHVANPPMVWGSAEVREDLKTAWHLGLDTTDRSQLYLYGNYAAKEVEGGFYFRNPDTRSGVYSPDGGATRLVADLTSDLSANCPTVLTDDQAALAMLATNPNCFAFNEILPGGFTPSLIGETSDFSTFIGFRGSFENGVRYDLNTNIGRSHTNFLMRNTINASLGPASPRNFDPGDYIQTEKGLNIDFSYALSLSMLASPLNIAFGSEWRNEEFEITGGELRSWEIGPLAAQGFTPATNGFPGFSPLAEGSWDRAHKAFYLDLETDITNSWLLGFATRWEDFEDFGTTTNSKLSTFVRLSEMVGLRASYSSGFRAPTPGQSNAFNISTVFDTSIMDLQNNGTIPSINPVARLRGGQPLEPEQSTNYAVGFTFDLGEVALTVDFYEIDLRDRLTLSRLYDLSDEERADLIAAGITTAATIENFQFFTNEIETQTRGIDLVGTWSQINRRGRTDYKVAFNRTLSEVESGITENVNAQRIKELEDALPSWRVTSSLKYQYSRWQFLARYNYYGKWYDSEDDVTYDGYGLLDVEMSYGINDAIQLTIGTQNLLDETPDENLGAAQGTGNRYSQYAPGGFNGRMLYARAVYQF